MQWPSVTEITFTCSVSKVKHYNYVKDLMFAGNKVGSEVASDADKVYEWNGDEEEWTVHGTILERRNEVGVSLVPLFSRVLDHCIT